MYSGGGEKVRRGSGRQFFDLTRYKKASQAKDPLYFKQRPRSGQTNEIGKRVALPRSVKAHANKRE